MNFRKQLISLIIAILVEICSPGYAKAQAERKMSYYKQRVSIGLNYSLIPKWEIKTLRSLELTYGKKLGNSSYTVLGSFSLISDCKCFDEENANASPSTTLPNSLGYFSFSTLLGRILNSSSQGLGNVGIYIGPSLRLGSENYFISRSGVELFFSSREAADLGATIKVSIEKPLSKRISLQLSGQYFHYLTNRKSEYAEFKPASTIFSGGLLLGYHF